MPHYAVTVPSRTATSAVAHILSAPFALTAIGENRLPNPIQMSLKDFAPNDELVITHATGTIHYHNRPVRRLRPGQLGANTNTTHRI